MHVARRRRSLLLAAPVLLALVAGACGDDSDEPAPVTAADLDGSTWGDAEVDGYELAGTLDVVFEDGRMSVTGGCNNQFGAYTIDDEGRLTVAQMASTMMACPDPLMAQDQWIAALLAGGVDTSIASLDDGAELTLAGDGATIRLRSTG